MSGDDPITSPEAWQTVYLAGVASPGIASVTGWTRDSDIDVKKASGGQGAEETYRGQPPATGKVVIRVGYSDIAGSPASDQFDALDAWLSLLAVDGTKGDIKGVDIRHPALAKLRPPVVSVMAQKVGQLEQLHEGDSLYSVTVELIEYKTDGGVNATQTPNGVTQSTPGTSGGGGGALGGTDLSGIQDPQPVPDANQIEITQLQNQLQDTSS